MAVILVHDNFDNQDSVGEDFAATARALGFYRLPTIGVMIQDAEFSRKNVYPTFLRTSPPYSHEANIVVKLIKELEYSQVIVATVFGDVNGEEFKTVFEEESKSNKITVQKYVSIYINDSLGNNIAEAFEETTSNIIILYAKPSKASKIIQIGLEVLGKDKVWIINEKASFATVPNGFLSVRLRKDPKAAFNDALLVIRSSGEYLLKLNQTSWPPENCHSIRENSEWIQHAGIGFYKHIISKKVLSANGEIKFNDKGDRITANYEVINKKNGEWQIVGNIANNGKLWITDKIEWINGIVKPQEIHLPEHLRVVAVPDPPFVYHIAVSGVEACKNISNVVINDVEVSGPWYPCFKRTNTTTTASFCCAGLAIDLIWYLSQPEDENAIKTNFTYVIYLNSTYGTPMFVEDKIILNGVTGELDSDMADLAIGALTINADREKYIDFTEPWMYHGIYIMEKYKPKDSPMESFSQPLKTSLWGAILLLVITIGCSIYALDYKSPFKKFYNKDDIVFEEHTALSEKEEASSVTFGEAMWFVWGVLLNSGVCEKTPRSFSARVLGLVWCGFCMIMVASYTANLAAFLVLDQPERGLSGITDPRLRNPSANYTFATVYDTNTYQYFKRSVELSTMFRKMEAHNVLEAETAINDLLNDTLDAFIWDSTRLEYEASKHCELRTRGSIFGRSGYGLGLQKNSPWTPHMTLAILKLSENGTLNMLNKKWIHDAGKIPCDVKDRTAPARLGLSNMRDIFILVVAGVFIGFLLSIIEAWYGRRKTNRQRQKQIAHRYADKWLKCCNMTIREYEMPSCKYSHNHLRIPQIQRDYQVCEAKSYHDLNRQYVINEVLRKKSQIIHGTNLIFRNSSTFIYCSRCRVSQKYLLF
uniref:PBPe domain-containing protein n=1 Tax=Rhabditophanes sp. KR3021 TaxID=114890 RepID=A0AC35U771_9BILA